MRTPVRPHIAVDVSPPGRDVVTGTERYTRDLVPHLARLGGDLEWIFYSPRPPPGLPVDTTVLPLPRLWSQLRLPMELWLRRPELTFVPAHAVPFAAPGQTLTVVHDLAFERYPSAYGWAQREYLRL